MLLMSERDLSAGKGSEIPRESVRIARLLFR